jgi:peptidyl-prolyl cis-trans isomerase D
MLRGIRSASANWLGKIVLSIVVGVLALSFAIWGIGDIFRGGGQTAVATVGSTQITVEQFRQIYNDRLQQISRQMGQPLRLEQARSLGLDRQILAQVIGETALDEWTQRLGLGITEDEVARLIRSFPAFQGPDGQFNHGIFVDRIRSAGYTEPRFVAEQRRVMIRQHLTDSIGGVTVTPKTYIDAVNSYQNEQRNIEYVALGPAQAGEIPTPTPEQLTEYFEKRRAAFRAPEYRKLMLIRLTPDDAEKWIQITDADARKFYEDRRTRYVTPGRRHLQQIVFPDEAQAREAKQRIDAGASFEEIAKARGLSEQDIDLGFVTPAAFAMAPAVAEAAFALPEGGVTNPVRARLGYALLRVIKAEPDQVQPYEQVADAIKQEMARDRARNDLHQRHDRIEDERAGGATLSEAAQKAGVPVIEIGAVDRAGRGPDGAPAPGLPTDADVLTRAFDTGVNIEADAIRLDNGGYIWFEVAGVTPSRERALDEVKELVESRWRADQVGERLKERAAGMLDKLKGGAPISEVAAAEGGTLSTAADLRRNARSDALPSSVVNLVFRTPKGNFGEAEGASPDERFIFRVTEVNVPPVDTNSTQGAQLDASLRNALSEDLLRQYLVFVEGQLGTTINAQALARVAGGETF